VVDGLAAGQVLTSREVLPDEEYRRTAFYNELCRPHDLHDLQCAVLERSPSLVVGFGMFRKGGATPEGEDAMRDKLATVLPHLSRALRLGLRLEQEGAARQALAQDTSRRVVSLHVDASLRVVAGDEDAEARLASCALRIEHGRVVVVGDEPGALALTRAVSTAALGSSHTVRLASRPEAPVRVVVAPRSQSPLLPPSRAAHLLVWLPDDGRVLATLRERYGLTKAEALVALRVARGRDLFGIASELGVSYHTVRVHLRGTFAKTGVGAAGRARRAAERALRLADEGARLLAGALVVARGLLDEVVVTRRALGLGHELGREEREPPEAAVPSAKRVAGAAARLDGGALTQTLDLGDAREIAPEARREASLGGEPEPHRQRVGGLGVGAELTLHARTLGLGVGGEHALERALAVAVHGVHGVLGRIFQVVKNTGDIALADVPRHTEVDPLGRGLGRKPRGPSKHEEPRDREARRGAQAHEPGAPRAARRGRHALGDARALAAREGR
jgi:DNA-binding CsgD family transcriptional regulator